MIINLGTVLAPKSGDYAIRGHANPFPGNGGYIVWNIHYGINLQSFRDVSLASFSNDMSDCGRVIVQLYSSPVPDKLESILEEAYIVNGGETH